MALGAGVVSSEALCCATCVKSIHDKHCITCVEVLHLGRTYEYSFPVGFRVGRDFHVLGQKQIATNVMSLFLILESRQRPAKNKFHPSAIVLTLTPTTASRKHGDNPSRHPLLRRKEHQVRLSGAKPP